MGALVLTQLLAFSLLLFINEPDQRIRMAYQSLKEVQKSQNNTLSDVRASVNQLEKVVRLASESYVDRKGRQVTLESNGRKLFEIPPKLPPEVKENGRWRFMTTHLNVVPKNLFIYEVSIKGDHTIRFRKITLTFQDGSQRIFDRWAHMEDGMGRAFSKRGFSPALQAWEKGGVPVARALKTISILGSAQDENHAANLSFRFTVPDPLDRPFRSALEKLAELKQFLKSPQAQPDFIADQIEKLAPLLGLPSQN